MRFSDIPIRGKLIIAFIVIGMLPLAIVGFFGDRLASQSLLEKSFDKLVMIQSLKKKQVEFAFKRFENDLKTLAGSERLASLIVDIEKYRQETDVSATEPFTVETSDYKKIAEKYQTAYFEYIETYGYHDMKVISSLSGKVVFTVAGERDLGANLVYGRYKESGLAEVWRQVVNTGKTVVVDFSPYEPTNGVESLFIGAPVYTRTGAMVSVVVLQMTPSFVNAIMDSREGMGKTGESYLIRWFEEEDRYEFRSNMLSMGDGSYVIGFELEQIPEYWKDATSAGFDGGYSQYLDSKGKEVLVAHHRLNIPGSKWYQISKIDRQEVLAPVSDQLYKAMILTAVLSALIFISAWIFSRRLVRPIIADVEFAKAISEGNLDASLDLQQKDELGVLARTLNEMAGRLKETDWMKRGKEGLDDRLRGEIDLKSLGTKFISYVVEHMEGQLGAFYLYRDEMLELVASHAFTDRNGNFNRIKLGEGLVGQATLEQRMIVFAHVKDATPEYNFGVDQQSPRYFLVAPLAFEREVVGAFLIGSFSPFTELQRRFIQENLENVAIFVNMAKSRQTIQELYEQSQFQQDELLVVNKGLEARTRQLKESEAELQAQQEELRVTNEELEERTEALQKSQRGLQAQQEELRVTNEELQERTENLERQKAALRQKTAQLVKARKEIEKKADELELGSKYKSEFLANMSHELRTPLNSILILSQILAANKNNNLDIKQIDAAKAIHSSGAELLTLINEILDLSKVEAGKIELFLEEVRISDMIDDVRRVFKDLAEDKGLAFDIAIDPALPPILLTDSQRVQQILRNLLTNAFKFTHHGGVRLIVSRPSPAIALTKGEAENLVAFAVQDDGIGIAEQQQEVIFKAFQQADGSTSRTYGGTGLGLSISRELTKLLGGTIHLESKEGRGSTFTFIVPERPTAAAGEQVADQEHRLSSPGTAGGAENLQTGEANEERPKVKGKVVDRYDHSEEGGLDDDQKRLGSGDKTLLIIEDDPNFAGVMRDFARERGFKCILAESGETGLHYADYYRPDAIILDIGLPGIDGWEVMTRLKENPGLRHIPVHFMSAADRAMDALRQGAIGFLAKPVTIEKVEEAFNRIKNIIMKPVSRLLVVEDDKIQAESIKNLVGNGDVVTTLVSTGREALAELESGEYDCLILDLGLSDMTGFELLDLIRGCEICARVPVIVYTGRDLTRQEEENLRKFTESIIIKGVRSPERLLDESALFLHRVEKNLPEHQKEKIRSGQRQEGVFEEKTILVVDDDMRNVFALTNLLEEKGVKIVVARDGLESLERLEHNKEIDLVLMDIMMPKMDGLEAMRRIRENPEFRDLPIIALTAKAMKGDRTKCIEAGANDYLAKPVDTDRLISILKVWLY
ncbi:MAG: histidine kinase [Desulfobulbaceae bacterium BRH_c16a]|nr:MAG: histidine kinase [Desulfobulbaceae bacterium BRH_c16a]